MGVAVSLVTFGIGLAFGLVGGLLQVPPIVGVMVILIVIVTALMCLYRATPRGLRL